jgi:hypothetical protein
MCRARGFCVVQTAWWSLAVNSSGRSSFAVLPVKSIYVNDLALGKER